MRLQRLAHPRLERLPLTGRDAIKTAPAMCRGLPLDGSPLFLLALRTRSPARALALEHPRPHHDLLRGAIAVKALRALQNGSFQARRGEGSGRIVRPTVKSPFHDRIVRRRWCCHAALSPRSIMTAALRVFIERS